MTPILLMRATMDRMHKWRLKVALYSFFAARGIGKIAPIARVCKKNFYFDDVTKNKGF